MKRSILRALGVSAVVAAATVGAGAASAGSADNGGGRPATLSCPDQFVAVPAGPVFPDRDKNGNGWVCVKETPNRLVVVDDTADPGPPKP